MNPHTTGTFPGISPSRWLAALALLAMTAGTPAQAQDNGPDLDTVPPPPESGLPMPEQSSEDQEQAPLPMEQIRLFTEALEAIRTGYVEEIDDRTLLEYAIRGMLANLDPHSAYLGSEEYQSLQENTQGEFGGLGIEVGTEDGYIKVISPIDDTPASRAGIQPGDLIVEINGQPVRDMQVNDAAAMLRGEPGTEVTLTLNREDSAEPIELTIQREVIAVESVRSRMLEPGFGYVRIAQFRSNAGDGLRSALDSLRQEDELNGLVLDLRNNPGGVLGTAAEVADVFLEEGRIVYTEGRSRQTDADYSASPGDAGETVPLVVLINGGSASASEIVAGALQDHGRAVIMGTPSFGKGSVQTILPLSNDRALKLTTSLYFTPDGRSIQAQGIAPDITVDQAVVTRQDRRSGYSEADLQGHLPGSGQQSGGPQGSQGSQGSDSGPTPQVSSGQVVVSDYQLNEALNLLKGWHIMSRSRDGGQQ